MDVISYALSKKYTDEKIIEQKLKVATVEKELNDYKNTLAQVNVNQEPRQSASGYGIVGLPKNAANGQVGVSLEGKTRANLTPNEFVRKDNNGFNGSFVRVKIKPNELTCISVENILNATTWRWVLRFYKNGVSVNTNDIDITKISGSFYRMDTTYIMQGINGTSKLLTFSDLDVDEIGIAFTLGDVSVDTISIRAMVEQSVSARGSYISYGTKSTISAMRLKSVGKNLVSEDKVMNGSVLWDTGGIGGLGFRTDYIRIKPNTRYTQNRSSLFTSRGVAFYDENKKYLSGLTTYNSNINAPTTFTTPNGAYYLRTSLGIKDNIQLEKGNTATEYEPYKESTAYVVAKDKDNKIVNLRSLPNGVKDEISLTDGKMIKRTKRTTINENNIVSTSEQYGQFYVRVDFEDGRATTTINIDDYVVVDGKKQVTYATRDGEIGNYYTYERECTSIWFIFASGTTLEQAKEELIGTTLTYQLAEPEIIPIEVSGNLVSYPNGTIYVEPAVADANVYNDGITIFEQELNIDYIDKIAKVDYVTGVETPLDISKAVIAEDRKSFTHPDLVNGDMVFFEYFYSNETTEGNATVEFYDSRYTIKDKSTEKYYQWDIEVDNGVPSIKLKEV